MAGEGGTLGGALKPCIMSVFLGLEPHLGTVECYIGLFWLRCSCVKPLCRQDAEDTNTKAQIIAGITVRSMMITSATL